MDRGSVDVGQSKELRMARFEMVDGQLKPNQRDNGRDLSGTGLRAYDRLKECRAAHALK